MKTIDLVVKDAMVLITSPFMAPAWQGVATLDAICKNAPSPVSDEEAYRSYLTKPKQNCNVIAEVQKQIEKQRDELQSIATKCAFPEFMKQDQISQSLNHIIFRFILDS